MTGVYVLGSSALLVLGLFLAVWSLRGYLRNLHALLEHRSQAHLNGLNRLTTALEEPPDRPGDIPDDLRSRLKELEIAVGSLPATWEEFYDKTRRSEERIRKAEQRAQAREEAEAEEEEVPPWEVAEAAGEEPEEGPAPAPDLDPVSATKLRLLGL